MPSELLHHHFLPGFLWGAATSSHRVEGNNRWNDWWAYEQSGYLPYISGEACRYYQRYEHDFDLA
jgi:beta-glucosidase